MDINDILARAKKNQKEAVTTSRYSTNVKPAKKLQRTVDPAAIKAFLDKKKNEENKNVKEAKKKKEELQKLRDVTKTTKKANSMAKRTKDNLKLYRGEDVLGLHTEPKKRRRGQPPSPPLSPEADRRHKAFMKNIVPKIKVPGVNDDDSDDGYSAPVLEEDERRIRKLEKKKAKARSASNLEFSELLQLAEKQKSKNDDDSSSSEDNDDDSGESDSDHDRHGRPLSAEEKYQRERRKRRELEERLKMASSHKPLPATSKTSHHKSSSSNSLANFKIGKLNSSMSEESKRLKVKELMEKLEKSSQEQDRSTQVKGRKEEKYNHSSSNSNMKKSHSSPALQNLSSKKHDDSVKSKHKLNGVRGESSKGSTSKHYHKSSTPELKNGSRNQPSAISSHKRKLVKPSRPSSDSEMRQTKIDPHLRKKEPFSGEKSKVKPAAEKHVSNPYKHTVVKQNMKRPAGESFVDPWAKSERGPSQNPGKKFKPTPAPGKCTLSVTSESVRTNYPGVAQEDPYISRYKKTGKVIPKLTPEMMARYKAAIMRKLQAEGRLPAQHQKQRYGAFPNESEDEYDSELEDFIADDEVEEEVDDNVDVSSHIRQIFGYDKSKYGRESEWELSRMDASYKDIEKEEKRSLKIAREEDAREARLEEERMKRKRR